MSFTPRIDLTIIIACYNAEELLKARVAAFEKVLKPRPWQWEILLCNDGSLDDTAQVCERLIAQSPQRRYFTHATNQGRGYTVRRAISESRGRWVGYVDADDSTAADDLIPILEKLQAGYEVVEAHRDYHGTLTTWPFIAKRFVASKAYAGLVRWFLGLRGHDTESGFKFFQRDALIKLADISHAPRWFWDTELIANAHRLGYHVAEVPSVFIRRPGMKSTLRLLPDSIEQFRQLLRFARNGWKRSWASCRGCERGE